MRKTRRRLVGVGVAAMLAVPAVGANAAEIPDLERPENPRSMSMRAGEAGPAAMQTQQEHATTYRIYGENRIATSVRTSQWLYWDAGYPDGYLTADAVILSRSDHYADALGGSALANAVNAPLLLTSRNSLRSDVKAEIDRILDPGATIYLLGGPNAISSNIEATLRASGYSTHRLAGANRYETSVTIAELINDIYAPYGGLGLVNLTTGRNFPDGLAAGPAAAWYGGAVLLTNGSRMPPSVQAFLDGLSDDTQVFAVGGPAAAASRDDVDLIGINRYDTSALVAEVFFGNPSYPEDDPIGIGLATGVNWPDALSGGAMVSGLGPLVLTKTNTLPVTTAAAVSRVVNQTDGTTPAHVEFGAVFGGPTVVGPTPANQFARLISGN